MADNAREAIGRLEKGENVTNFVNNMPPGDQFRLANQLSKPETQKHLPNLEIVTKPLGINRDDLQGQRVLQDIQKKNPDGSKTDLYDTRMEANLKESRDPQAAKERARQRAEAAERREKPAPSTYDEKVKECMDQSMREKKPGEYKPMGVELALCKATN